MTSQEPIKKLLQKLNSGKDFLYFHLCDRFRLHQKSSRPSFGIGLSMIFYLPHQNHHYHHRASLSFASENQAVHPDTEHTS